MEWSITDNLFVRKPNCVKYITQITEYKNYIVFPIAVAIVLISSTNFKYVSGNNA